MWKNKKIKGIHVNSRFWPWMICIVGVLFYCYEYFLRVTPSVMTNSLMRDFSVNALALGSLSAFYYYAYTPMQLPVGLLLDRIGPRRSLTLACLLCAVASYFFATTHSLVVLDIARFFIGIGSAFAFVGVLVLATIWLPKDRFALFAGLASGIGTIGAMAADMSLSQGVTWLGWRHTVLLTAMVGLVLAVLIYVVVRGRRYKIPRSTSVAEAASFKELVRQLILVLRNPQMWLLGAIGCLLYLPTTAFAELWGIPYMRSVYHFSDVTASSLNSLIFLGFTLGAPVAGYISDRIGRRCLPMAVGALLAAAVICIIIYVANLPEFLLAILLFLLGVFYGVEAIVFASGKELCSKDYSGTAIAVTNMFVMLGGVIFQPLLGEILDWRWSGKYVHGARYFAASDYRFALSVVPIALVIGALLTYFLKETGWVAQRNNKSQT